jgi:hypothetical protein
MKKPSLRPTSHCALASAWLLFSVALPAQIERQHDAHVHGAAEGNLVLEDTRLRLELEIPGVNLVGFEHAPRNDDQRKLLGHTLSLLERGDWLLTDPRGQCSLKSVDAHTHGFGGFKLGDESESDHSLNDHHPDGRDSEHSRHDHDEHHHDHHHHHDVGHDGYHDDHQEHDHEHAEFHLVAVLQCQSPKRLRWVELNLFDEFPGNETVRLDVLTDQFATRLHLHSGARRVDLRARH